MQNGKKRAAVVIVSCLSGGSGKTTTVLNLASMLSLKGKTLAIDFDPQGNLSQWLGWFDLSQTATIAETIIPDEAVGIDRIIKSPQVEVEGDLWLAPSDYSLTNAGELIATRPGRERFLIRAIKPILHDYDYIVIDSPPSKANLTYNSVLAADYLVIPSECTDKGVIGAISTINLLRELEEIDFKVPKILGVLPTRDQWSGQNQTLMSKAAIASLKEKLLDIKIFSSIRHSTKVQKANHAGLPIAAFGESKLSQPYQEIVEFLLATISRDRNESANQEAFSSSYPH